MMLPLFPESLLFWLLPFAALLLAGFLALPGRSCPMHSSYRAKVYDKYASPYYLQRETIAMLTPVYVVADEVQFNQMAKDTVLILKELDREQAQVLGEPLTEMAAS